MAHGKITDRWTCDFMYDFYNGGMLLEVYTDYRILPGLKVRIGEFKVPYTIENELSPTTVELINCYSQSVCYLAGVSGSDVACGMTSGRDIGAMVHGGLLNDLLCYKLAIMNGQGLNIKDKNNQKDIIGNLMVNPEMAVGGWFVYQRDRTRHCRLRNNRHPGRRKLYQNRWSIGGIITTTPFSLRSEYLAGKDGGVKSDGFYATGCYRMLRNFDLVASYDYFNANKAVSRKQTNYIAGLQYWFYPKCRLQAQYTFRDRNKGKDSNLFQAQVQVRF